MGSGFLNDFNFVHSQLSNRIRQRQTRSNRKQINYNEQFEELYGVQEQNKNGQKCVFEEGDDDEDYVMNDHDDDDIDSEQQMEENAVWIDDRFRLSKGDKIRIKENKCEQHGVIEQIMKYHIKVNVRTENGNRLKRIKYKDINKGLVNVFLRE